MKTVYIESLGCSKNQVDSEKMAALLEKNGYTMVDDAEFAEAIIVNTCGFIQSAKTEAISVVFDAIKYKKKAKCKKVIVAGCFAERYYDQCADEFSENEVDGIIGIGDISKIIDVLESEKRSIVIPETKEDFLIDRKLSGFPGSTYLRISDGCSNHCSYCAIPLIRGELRSRKIENIIAELDMILANNKIHEINIISQDTSNYGVDLYKEQSLAKLLSEIDSRLIDSQILRVLYMHPDHISEELIKSLAKLKHFVPYFDIPFQSGSENILKAMGRVGSSEKYLDLIKMIRNYFPNAVFRSTFIAGFPGETVLDVNNTLDFIKNANMQWVGAFAYSDEEGTKAYTFIEKVPGNKAQKRQATIMDISEEVSILQLEKFIGLKLDFLIEERIDEDLCIGRFWGQAPEVDGVTVIDSSHAKPGDLINAKVVKVNGRDLFATEI